MADETDAAPDWLPGDRLGWLRDLAARERKLCGEDAPMVRTIRRARRSPVPAIDISLLMTALFALGVVFACSIR